MCGIHNSLPSCGLRQISSPASDSGGLNSSKSVQEQHCPFKRAPLPLSGAKKTGVSWSNLQANAKTAVIQYVALLQRTTHQASFATASSFSLLSRPHV